MFIILVDCRYKDRKLTALSPSIGYYIYTLCETCILSCADSLVKGMVSNYVQLQLRVRERGEFSTQLGIELGICVYFIAEFQPPGYSSLQ